MFDSEPIADTGVKVPQTPHGILQAWRRNMQARNHVAKGRVPYRPVSLTSKTQSLNAHGGLPKIAS